jgi:hypothetical protein
MRNDDHGSKGFLTGAFGKAAAITALAATAVFYVTGFNVAADFYHQWQDNKAVAEQSWSAQPAPDHLANTPWKLAVESLGVSLATGFGAIALGKAHRRAVGQDDGSGGYYGGGYSSSYDNGNDNFFLGYMLGSSNSSSSSSSSSDDNGGAAAALVIAGVAAAAAGAGVVTYKALKYNFTPGQQVRTLNI